jgi:outer membrane receptor protein involved in Fe transport
MFSNSSPGARRALRATCAALALAAAPSAWGQETGGSAAEQNQDDPNMIIVQALKQNETLLDTPATVTVVEGSALQSANITSAQQLSGLVPGYTSMQGVAGTSASFRGLGSNAADPVIESSVGAFVDGVYLGHARDFVMPLYDTQQIEFIAGTQSTLLGKNTSLGAISITTRRPGDELRLEGSAAYTSDIGALRVQGAADLPLGNDLAVRAVGFFEKEQGFVRNLFLDRREQDVENWSGRLVLDGNVSDAVRLTAIYQHDRRRSDGQNFELLTDPNFTIEGTARSLGQTLYESVPNDRTYSGSERLIPGAPAGTLPFDDHNSDRLTAIVEIDMGSGLTLTSQSSYLKWDSTRLVDLDLVAFRLLDLQDDERNEVLSQEIRIASDESSRFSYMVGLFYYYNDYSLRRGVASDLGLSLDSLSAVGTNSWSAFASGRYDLSDHFALRAGIRQSWEDKRATYDISGNLALPIARTRLPTTSNNELDGNIGLDFTPNGRTLIYASYSRGSKAGGYQSTPDSLDVAAYGTEAAYTKELGAKFKFGGDTWLQFALFDTIVKNFQAGRLVVQPGFPLPQAVISNVDARTTGAEASGRLAVGQGLSLTASLTYADSRFTEGLLSEVAPGVFAPEISDGMRLPRAPRWSGQFSALYETTLSDALELQLRGTIRYSSAFDLQFRTSQPLAPRSEQRALVDLEARIASDSGWSLAVLGNNLTNIRRPTFTSEHLLDGDAFYGTRNRPRTVSLQLGLAF